MERWERNIKALAKKNKRLAEELEKVLEESQDENIVIQDLENGSRILGINYKDRIWYLNSRLDPEGAAGLYTDRYEIKPFYRYFVFGFSDGRVVRRLLEKCDNSNAIIICEPNKKLLTEAVKQYDLEDIFLDKRVLPCISELWEDMQKILFDTVEYGHINLLEFCILPGYDLIYTEQCQNFMDVTLDRMKEEIVNKSTYIGFNRNMPKSILFNMRNMIRHSNFAQVRDEIEKVDIENVPAIIISAGPSLDKNIREIKKAEGKAFIFVVDAALRTVMREEIRPNVVCSVDAKAPERFFEGAENHEFAWACDRTTNPAPLQKYGKKVFYYNFFNSWWDEVIEEELGYEFPKMDPGGCVSAEAFQLARYLGFKTIILIGQDLAFTGGQSHTSGIKGVLGDNDEYIQNRYIVQVEDAEGNLLDTDFQMSYYKEWFEKTIKEEQGRLRVIDATEGGAKIAGTIIQPLKETIEQECRKDIDFYRLLDNIRPAFDDGKKQYLYQKLDELNDQKVDMKKRIEGNIRQIEMLLAKIRGRKADNQYIAKELEKMVYNSTILDQHPFMQWITLYAKEEEYDLQEDIFTKEDMGVEEIVERSLRLLHSYQNAIPMFEEDFAEALNTQ